MRRLGLVTIILLCSCRPNAGTGAVGGSNSNEPFVPKAIDRSTAPTLISGDISEIVTGAMEEFYTSRWSDWNVGELIALEPAWTTGRFDDFDKAVDYWVAKFGNDGSASEETLKRIRETITAVGSPAAVGNRVEKGLDTLNLGMRVVLIPTTYFDNSIGWVPGAVQFTSPSGVSGGIRAKGAISYPLFSGDGRYAFLQMNHVKAGNEYGQLHFFMEKQSGKWQAIAVGRMPE